MRMRTRTSRLKYGPALCALALGCLAAAQAQDLQSDPPARAGRLSYTEGAVSLQPAGVQEWTAAPLNRPLTSGDRLWSDQNSRAEVDIGSAVIRLGHDTGISFFDLDDRTAQIQLAAGTLIVGVRELEEGQVYEVDTPNLAVSLLQPGVYRIEVNEAGDTTVVKVSEGSAQAQGGGQNLAIGMQQMARFTGTQALMYDTGTLSAPDDFDAWSAARERGLTGSPSREYVADAVPGTQDLDSNGTWQSTPEYGPVWMPTVVFAGWAPYRFGYWAWIAPWGYTWIDEAAWGYAPFHYGRWVLWNHGWCWVPGPRHVRPVYAPALVGWVGGEPASGRLAALGPRVGWFPLGPRELYVPAAAVSAAYVRNVNLTNTTGLSGADITNGYQNKPAGIGYVHRTPGAVTAVPEEVFSSGGRVSTNFVRLSAATLAAAPLSSAAPALTPGRQSVLGPPPSRPPIRPPAALLNRPALARTPPPRAPAPFERQVAAIQANGGHPLSRTELAKLQPPVASAPVRVLPPSSRPLTGAPVAGGATAAPAAPPGVPHPNTGRPLPGAPADRGVAPSRAAPVTPGAPLRSDRPPGSAPAGRTAPLPAPRAPPQRAPAAAPAPATPPAVIRPPPASRAPPPSPRGSPSSSPQH